NTARCLPLIFLNISSGSPYTLGSNFASPANAESEGAMLVRPIAAPPVAIVPRKLRRLVPSFVSLVSIIQGFTFKVLKMPDKLRKKTILCFVNLFFHFFIRTFCIINFKYEKNVFYRRFFVRHYTAIIC